MKRIVEQTSKCVNPGNNAGESTTKKGKLIKEQWQKVEMGEQDEAKEQDATAKEQDAASKVKDEAAKVKTVQAYCKIT